jgi:CHAD domain-containing protein
VPGDSLGRCLQRYLHGQVEEVRRLAGSLEAGAGDTTLHDLRVALRRIHSVLTAASSAYDGSATRDLRDAVRADLRRLGGPRDVEVMDEVLLPRIDDPADRALVRAILQGRHDRALAGADAADLTGLLHALDRLVTTPPTSSRAERPARKEARRLTRQQVRRLLRIARHADLLASDAARWDALHDVRKAAKRLRYLLDATADARDPGRLADDLKHLQKVLGDQHDLVVAATVLRELGAAEPDGGLLRLAADLEAEAESVAPAYRSALAAVTRHAPT